MRKILSVVASMFLLSCLASCQAGEVVGGGPAVYEKCDGAFSSFSGEVTDAENDGNTSVLRESLDMCSSREAWEKTYAAHPSTPPSADPRAAADAFEKACQRPELADTTLCAQAASVP